MGSYLSSEMTRVKNAMKGILKIRPNWLDAYVTLAETLGMDTAILGDIAAESSGLRSQDQVSYAKKLGAGAGLIEGGEDAR